MKRMVCCLLLMIALMFCMFNVMAFAKGSDDGVLYFTTKSGKEYLGTKQSSFCIKFDAANGDNSSFYRYDGVDLTSDKNTDITDLVALRIAVNSQTDGLDLNFDTHIDSDDLAVLRGIIIGNTDIEIG